MIARGFGEVAERLRRSTVQVTCGERRERGGGSGVIWDSDGLIITNAHVVRTTHRARVELWDGSSLPAEVAVCDTRRDLASLRIKSNALPSAASGDSSALRAGELVVAVGNPYGFIGALTTGVVHGLGPVRGLGHQKWVQAAIRLGPGNSGGPLADATGRVIGINTMVVSGGLALAIPSQTVLDFVRRGASGPALGVVIRPVRMEGSRSLGLLVLEVSPTGPAAAASLMTGDLLTGANGLPFGSVDDLGGILDSVPQGTVVLQFYRGDRTRQREVTVKLQQPGVLNQGAAA